MTIAPATKTIAPVGGAPGVTQTDATPAAGVLALLRAHYPDLNAAEQKVADHILREPGTVHRFPIARLAEVTGTSTGSVMRLCQRVGFPGYAAFRVALAVELLTPGYTPDERIDGTDSPWSALTKALRSGMSVLDDTLNLLDPRAVEQAAAALAGAKRVEFYGTGGISASLCQLAQQRFLRLGLVCAAYTDREALTYSAGLLGPGCVAVGVSHYGTGLELPPAIRLARSSGATTIAITSAPRSRLAEEAEILLLTGARDNIYFSDAVASRVPVVALIDGLYAAVAILRDRASYGAAASDGPEPARVAATRHAERGATERT